MDSIGTWAAFLAGVASFLSPCVLPLVPGYVSMISGVSFAELSAPSAKGAGTAATLRAGLASAAFVLGFTIVFVAMGATASAVGKVLTAYVWAFSKIAGVLVIVFGLHTAGAITIPWLYYEKRLSASGVGPGYGGAVLMGMAFAFGWTPCIGPILATILAMAATQERVLYGVWLLAVYSLGLGIPFILAGLSVGAFVRLMARYKPFIRWGEIVAGSLLVVIGALIFLDKTALVVRLLPASLGRFSR
ncbi:MAG: cytochrome c biogenesis protein CcdA [Elusimicrobia bacterium]|nr:cytochrome c biogenesis protein CcdA [Elusimicrobiota bacterium]